MLTDQVFAELKALGLATNHRQFSTAYLGRSARYYDYLRCSGAEPGMSALITLAMQVRAKFTELALGPYQLGAAERLDGLANQIWDEIQRRARLPKGPKSVVVAGELITAGTGL